MKKYDREKKKWVEETDINKKLKKRELCRGGKEHDYVLVLPEHVTYTEDYKHNPEAYYAILDEIEEFSLKAMERITALGVVSKYYSMPSKYRRVRLYLCSVCKKKHHEYPDN